MPSLVALLGLGLRQTRQAVPKLTCSTGLATAYKVLLPAMGAGQPVARFFANELGRIWCHVDYVACYFHLRFYFDFTCP